MSLNGTLETFALPDVLALLSATKKTGVLQVDGGRGEARVWLDKGEMVGADVPRAATFVDALFEMLRLTSGNFAFENDGTPASPSGPRAIEPLLQEAQSRLGEWKSIEAVVPSLACAVKLAAEVSGAQVSITAEQWRALVAVAMNPDVEGVMGALGLGEFDSCRMLKDLVQIGLVSVGDAPPAGAEAAEHSAEPAQPTQIAEVPAPAAEGPAPEPERPTFKAPVNERAPFKPPVSDRPAFQPPSSPASSPSPPPPARRVSGSTLVAAARSHGADEKPASAARSQRADDTLDSAARSHHADDTVDSTARSQGSDDRSDSAARPSMTAGAATRAAKPAGAAAAAAAAKSTAKVKAPALDAAEQDADDLSPAELVHQLAALQGDVPPLPRRPAAGAPSAGAPEMVPAATAATAPDDDQADPAKGEEPLNRGLLLKFLNSVRS